MAITKSDIDIIKDYIVKLTPREEQIIRMRFGIGLETTFTLHQIGMHFRLSRSRIWQIEKEAFRKLREHLEDAIEHFEKKHEILKEKQIIYERLINKLR